MITSTLPRGVNHYAAEKKSAKTRVKKSKTELKKMTPGGYAALGSVWLDANWGEDRVQLLSK
jgi:hypothetical protein